MKQEIKPVHGMWASRWVFILAATGSAVGLGNIWRFPYITGENGGGAFVLLYLLCIAVVGIPIMAAEVMLGRKGGLSPINSMRKVAADSKVDSRAVKAVVPAVRLAVQVLLLIHKEFCGF